MTKRRTSLADVARAAGVGLATASRALSGNSDVAQATRDRVLDTANDLGYRPSAAARALRTGRSTTIAVVVDSPISADVLEGILRECTRAGYQVLLLEATTSVVSGGSSSQNPDLRPDGVISISARTTDARGEPVVSRGGGRIGVSVAGSSTTGSGFARGAAAVRALIGALGDEE